MINVGGFELRSLTVGLRWARMNGFPDNLVDWNKEHNSRLQWVCEELDRRRIKRIQKQNEDWCF